MMTTTTTIGRRPPFEFIKSTLLNGALVILPFGVLAIVVLKIVGMLEPFAVMISEWLPRGLRFPAAIALALLFLSCLLVGLLAQTRSGRGVGTALEGAVLNRIPGYSMVRSLTKRIGNVEDSKQFAPALVEIEAALVPGFIVEEHEDGGYTVFVPSAPTPAVGAIYIVTRERVHLIDASFVETVRCVSNWGVGAAKLLKSMHAETERTHKSH